MSTSTTTALAAHQVFPANLKFVCVLLVVCSTRPVKRFALAYGKRCKSFIMRQGARRILRGRERNATVPDQTKTHGRRLSQSVLLVSCSRSLEPSEETKPERHSHLRSLRLSISPHTDSFGELADVAFLACNFVLDRCCALRNRNQSGARKHA